MSAATYVKRDLEQEAVDEVERDLRPEWRAKRVPLDAAICLQRGQAIAPARVLLAPDDFHDLCLGFEVRTARLDDLARLDEALERRDVHARAERKRRSVDLCEPVDDERDAEAQCPSDEEHPRHVDDEPEPRDIDDVRDEQVVRPLERLDRLAVNAEEVAIGDAVDDLEREQAREDHEHKVERRRHRVLGRARAVCEHTEVALDAMDDRLKLRLGHVAVLTLHLLELGAEAAQELREVFASDLQVRVRLLQARTGA